VPEAQDIHQLYERHGDEVLHYLARRCPHDMAQDLLQETFLQVVRYGSRLSTVSMPRAWLFGIARNILARHHRRQPVAAQDELWHESTAAESSDSRLPAVREAIGRLPFELRETLELRLEQELSYEEIAGVLEIPVGTVRSRLHNAVLRLRAALTGDQQKS
jgi:RNA polymerase sigma-70 factor (ECF subfamily)